MASARHYSLEGTNARYQYAPCRQQVRRQYVLGQRRYLTRDQAQLLNFCRLIGWVVLGLFWIGAATFRLVSGLARR